LAVNMFMECDPIDLFCGVVATRFISPLKSLLAGDTSSDPFGLILAQNQPKVLISELRLRVIPMLQGDVTPLGLRVHALLSRAFP